MSNIIGLDIGTSGVKGLLVSDQGEVLTESRSGYQVANPRAGWAEQDPEDWWQATLEVLQKLSSWAQDNDAEIAGLSFSGQMHSSVFLDEKDRVIRPAILWSDTRTSAECEEIEERVGSRKKLIQLTGNRALEGFTAPKILWLKNNEPENYQRCRTLLLPKDYIRWRLTGVKNMDYSDAAGTLLLDVKNRRWHPEVTAALDLDEKVLPPLCRSVDITGKITAEAAELTGLASGTPVVAGGADNACGAAGSGLVREGRVMVSIGSSGVVLAPTKKFEIDPQGRLHLFNHSDPESYYYMGVMLAAGQALSWAKNQILPENWNYDVLNNRASQISPGSESLIFLPYLYGERTPHADADARGVFFGLSARHGKAHLARSVMEGVTFGLKDSLELVKDRGIEIDRVRAIGGGARSNLWQQIVADIFEVPVDLLEVEEGPAYGAAMLAGVGVGLFESLQEVDEKLIKVKSTVKPKQPNSEKYRQLYQVFKSLYPALKDIYPDLNL